MCRTYTLKRTDVAGLLLNVYNVPQPRFLSTAMSRHSYRWSHASAFSRKHSMLQGLEDLPIGNLLFTDRNSKDIPPVWKRYIVPALGNTRSAMNTCWEDMYTIWDAARLTFAIGIIFEYISGFQRDALLDVMQFRSKETRGKWNAILAPVAKDKK